MISESILAEIYGFKLNIWLTNMILGLKGLKPKHLDLLAKELANEIQDLYKQIRGK